jgi:hypothetical protein
MLISFPDIKKQLNQSQPNEQLYKRLQKIIAFELFIYGSIIVLALFIFMTHQKILALAALPIFIVLQKLYSANRSCVAKISVSLITQDISPAQIASQTLFQICENYSRKLNIPSLVDAITHQDEIARKILIYTQIFCCYIYPLDFCYIWITLACSFFVTLAAINTSFIYNKLK